MQNWDEIRTALQVAREGTVSAAAAKLGVHHATVIRHVDALEESLGVKLFQRHARGYTPTEAGQELMRVGQTTEDQFNALEGKLRGNTTEVTGELVVTTLTPMIFDLMPVVATFQKKYPDVTVRVITGERLFRLEYGEAHVALRAGNAPQDPDNVVQRYRSYPLTMFASRDYVERYGIPADIADYSNHRFVVRSDEPRGVPMFDWMRDNVPKDAIRLVSSDDSGIVAAVKEGIGIGLLAAQVGEADEDLVQIREPEPDWMVQLWIVTHVDLHRTPKVQAFLAELKQAAAAASR